tara:strand:+ start:378 stop:767 length:390 start_codon:yes stop_codon:yes gene_type:complete
MDKINKIVNEAVRTMLISDLERDRPLPPSPKEVYVWKIITIVCDYYEAYIKDVLTSSNRYRQNVLAKQVAMFFISKDYNYTHEELGIIFNTHRTSVIYSIKKIKDWMEFDPQMQIDYIEIRKELNKIYE